MTTHNYHNYTVAKADGTVIGAFYHLVDAIEYAESRKNKYKELFVRDANSYELLHYAKRDW